MGMGHSGFSRSARHPVYNSSKFNYVEHVGDFNQSIKDV